MDRLKNVPALIVQQKKEWGEILTGFETKNKYSIRDPQGNELYFAAEESNLLLRLFLKMLRPLTFHIVSKEGSKILKIKKPFRFYFHEVTIQDDHGKGMGRVRREFSLFKRNFTIFDAMGVEIYKITGPFLHPWTFHIVNNGNEVGKISKKWSGLGKELFTDADNFSVEFGSISDLNHKASLLGALFLIDLLYFESK